MNKKIIVLIIFFGIISNIFSKELLVENIGDTVFYQSEPKILKLKLTNIGNYDINLNLGANRYSYLNLTVYCKELNIDTKFYPNKGISTGYSKKIVLKKGESYFHYIDLKEFYDFSNLGDYKIYIDNVSVPENDAFFRPLKFKINIKIIPNDFQKIKLKKHKFLKLIKSNKITLDEKKYYYKYLFESRKIDKNIKYRPVEFPHEKSKTIMYLYGQNSYYYKRKMNEFFAENIYNRSWTIAKFKKLDVLKIICKKNMS